MRRLSLTITVLSVVCGYSVAGFAEGHCSRIFRPAVCARTAGCHWDSRAYECVPNHRPAEPDCEDIWWPAECNRTDGCRWDHRASECVSHEWPVVRDCEDIWHAPECNRTDGCRWDHRDHECVSDEEPGGELHEQITILNDGFAEALRDMRGWMERAEHLSGGRGCRSYSSFSECRRAGCDWDHDYRRCVDRIREDHALDQARDRMDAAIDTSDRARYDYCVPGESESDLAFLDSNPPPDGCDGLFGIAKTNCVTAHMEIALGYFEDACRAVRIAMQTLDDVLWWLDQSGEPAAQIDLLEQDVNDIRNNLATTKTRAGC